ncbi:T2AG factor, partial [Halcyon senegalensis]|nr:T2AG factor [Halcyon senegalensis]
MAYQLYRNTTLGNSLQESLDELIQLALQVLLQFDKAINSALAQRVRNRGSLNTYFFFYFFFFFVLNDVEFREVTFFFLVFFFFIVACDGKS